MDTPHLRIERLAELADEAPTPFEREHLAACPTCASEASAYQHLVAGARDERRRIAPPITEWDKLQGALAAEGLVVPAAARTARATRARWMQRVAGAALFLATGTVLGRFSAGLPAGEALGGRPGTTAGATPLVPVANAAGAFDSPDAALAQLQQAQRLYDEAAAWLSAHDTTSSIEASDQYRTRLAALDLASETFEQALTNAPEDPILNQYFMATMNAREVAIRRLGTTVPAGMRVGRF